MFDNELIALIRKKDKAAVRELYVRYSPVMLSICRRYMEDQDIAQDIMHDGFIKIVTKIHTYSGKGSFEGWMKRIIVHTAINYYHKIKKEGKTSLENIHVQAQMAEDKINEDIEDSGHPSKEVNLDTIFKADLSIEDIWIAISGLPEKYRLVMNLFVIEKYSHREVALMLQIDENACRTRLSRGRDMLKKILYQKSIERIAK